MYYFHHDLNCYCFMLFLRLVKRTLFYGCSSLQPSFVFRVQLSNCQVKKIPVNFVTLLDMYRHFKQGVILQKTGENAEALKVSTGLCVGLGRGVQSGHFYACLHHTPP